MISLKDVQTKCFAVSCKKMISLDFQADIGEKKFPEARGLDWVLDFIICRILEIWSHFTWIIMNLVSWEFKYKGYRILQVDNRSQNAWQILKEQA